MEHPPSPDPITDDEDNEEVTAANARALQKMVFEDFDAAVYASKTSIDVKAGDNPCEIIGNVWRYLEFVDPRGYLNITWLSLQGEYKGPSLYDEEFADCR